jgi:predicted transport protein
MDKAEQTMLDNLHKNTGKTLEEWIKIVRKEKFEKHGQILKWLKENHGFTHGFANLIALKSRGTDAGSVENKDTLIEAQYKGKEYLRPIYDKLMKEIAQFGNDIEVAPKKAYVSLRRKKQFAMLQPATKTRFEIGLNVKGKSSQGILEEVKTANAMCSHKINVTSENEISPEVIDWLKISYQDAG